ncbi:unnamed protein product [Rangifer tarandus platyrhynchus]|uniref:Uncharacterized protein n=1 Tax=Rangifer tarandus platyrhynchus TaxID=3082113 RepID=A0ABN8YEF9_RANTA|nr:unnamed protein product [Rangifer tarandus platyrhynchus]
MRKAAPGLEARAPPRGARRERPPGLDQRCARAARGQARPSPERGPAEAWALAAPAPRFLSSGLRAVLRLPGPGFPRGRWGLAPPAKPGRGWTAPVQGALDEDTSTGRGPASSLGLWWRVGAPGPWAVQAPRPACCLPIIRRHCPAPAGQPGSSMAGLELAHGRGGPAEEKGAEEAAWRQPPPPFVLEADTEKPHRAECALTVSPQVSWPGVWRRADSAARRRPAGSAASGWGRGLGRKGPRGRPAPAAAGTVGPEPGHPPVTCLGGQGGSSEGRRSLQTSPGLSRR